MTKTKRPPTMPGQTTNELLTAIQQAVKNPDHSHTTPTVVVGEGGCTSIDQLRPDGSRCGTKDKTQTQLDKLSESMRKLVEVLRKGKEDKVTTMSILKLLESASCGDLGMSKTACLSLRTADGLPACTYEKSETCTENAIGAVDSIQAAKEMIQDHELNADIVDDKDLKKMYQKLKEKTSEQIKDLEKRIEKLKFEMKGKIDKQDECLQFSTGTGTKECTDAGCVVLDKESGKKASRKKIIGPGEVCVPKDSQNKSWYNSGKKHRRITRQTFKQMMKRQIQKRDADNPARYALQAWYLENKKDEKISSPEIRKMKRILVENNAAFPQKRDPDKNVQLGADDKRWYEGLVRRKGDKDKLLDYVIGRNADVLVGGGEDIAYSQMSDLTGIVGAILKGGDSDYLPSAGGKKRKRKIRKRRRRSNTGR